MPLPKAEELGLPIKNPPISGPAVDMLENRKEENNNKPFSAEKLSANFEAIRDDLMTRLKQIIG